MAQKEAVRSFFPDIGDLKQEDCLRSFYKKDAVKRAPQSRKVRNNGQFLLEEVTASLKERNHLHSNRIDLQQSNGFSTRARRRKVWGWFNLPHVIESAPFRASAGFYKMSWDEGKGGGSLARALAQAMALISVLSPPPHAFPGTSALPFHRPLLRVLG